MQHEYVNISAKYKTCLFHIFFDKENVKQYGTLLVFISHAHVLDSLFGINARLLPSIFATNMVYMVGYSTLLT